MGNIDGNVDFYLRELEKKDASENYIAWLNDPEINQFLETRFLPEQTMNTLEVFIDACFKNDTLVLCLDTNHKHSVHADHYHDFESTHRAFCTL